MVLNGVGTLAGQRESRRQDSGGWCEVDLCGWVTASWHQVDAAKVFGSDELGGRLACLLACFVVCNSWRVSYTVSYTVSYAVSYAQKFSIYLAFSALL